MTIKAITTNLLALSLAMGTCAQARDHRDHDEEEIEFSVAQIFFELNNTDGDLGIHALIDGEPWKKLEIEDPRGRELLDVDVKSRLKRQGLTEFFFESAEPTFDELSPAKFFRRFPAGTYEIEGKTLDRKDMESETLLTHFMPAPPETSVNDEDEAMQCDDEVGGFDAPEVSAPITISWAEVDMTHPDIGASGDITIYNYEVVVEAELEVDGEEFTALMSAKLPPGSTSMTVPAEFIALVEEELGEEGEVNFKYEVLAREVSFNQTATESCFVLTD